LLGQDGYPLALQEMFYREAGENYNVPAHVQKFTQWYCVIHGCAEQRVDGQSFVLGALESVLVPPNAVRSPRSRAKSVGYIVGSFENKRLNLEPIMRRKLLCPVTLRSDIHALVAELRAGRSAEKQDMILALLPRILIGLRRGVGDRLKATNTVPSPLNLNGNQALVAKLENYMRTHLQNPLERADLAKVAHLSPSHLARVFRATTNKSLIERLTELRLAQACAMLGESSLPITRIALDVGFNSFSHFTSLFKKNIGMSPSEYRKSGGYAWKASGPV
jgi:AraC-like DNA-binding protein